MTYRGHVRDGRVALDEPAELPEGAAVRVELVEPAAKVSRPAARRGVEPFEPLRMPGDSLADELVRDRR